MANLVNYLVNRPIDELTIITLVPTLWGRLGWLGLMKKYKQLPTVNGAFNTNYFFACDFLMRRDKNCNI